MIYEFNLLFMQNILINIFELFYYIFDTAKGCPSFYNNYSKNYKKIDLFYLVFDTAYGFITYGLLIGTMEIKIIIFY